MESYDNIAARIPEIDLPKTGTDLKKWAVIACDQFTSQPEYWRKVEDLVGDSPSTLNLIFPEIRLNQPGEIEDIRKIQSTMQEYLDQRFLTAREGFVYVERTVGGKSRRGLMLCLDLDRYDYNRGSKSLIRATEGTIVDRLPPRMKIREGAALELPHILVLIDDPMDTVIEPLQASRSKFEKLYDFDLMLESGHLTGYAVSRELDNQILSALSDLAKPEVFAQKYGLRGEQPILLFAVGDGNHSLAAAKAVWENIKSSVASEHPARYALVEIENVHDEGLEFKPIHRVLFNVKKDLLAELRLAFGEKIKYSQLATVQEMTKRVETARGGVHTIGLVGGGTFGIIEIEHPASNLPLGTLQPFLDHFLSTGGAEKIDYVHGEDILVRLGSEKNNTGFYLPVMQKSDLFKTVILDGTLPRKTFSMGEAHEKRFYMEARKISIP